MDFVSNSSEERRTESFEALHALLSASDMSIDVDATRPRTRETRDAWCHRSRSYPRSFNHDVSRHDFAHTRGNPFTRLMFVTGCVACATPGASLALE